MGENQLRETSQRVENVAYVLSFCVLILKNTVEGRICFIFIVLQIV